MNMDYEKAREVIEAFLQNEKRVNDLLDSIES